jgi:hypothetical protein
MSETPRTDAARQDEHDPYMAVAAECAKMEKELTECDDLIRRLEDVVYDPHALWTNWLRGDVKLPVGIGDVREAQDRIKHLQDIINRAHLAFFSDSSDRNVSIAMHRILDEEVRKESQ